MANSTTFSEENSKTTNRRARARDPLNWVVLVYFGDTNWGRLLNLNKNGMCFEFAEPPKQGQQIRFTLESMGRLPASLESEVLSEKLLAAGEIKWIHEFERTAGVQFTELSDESGDLIELWFSYKGYSSGDATQNEMSQQAGVPVSQSDFPKAMELLNEAAVEKLGPSRADTKWGEAHLSVEPVGTLEPRLVDKILEAPTFEAYSRVMAEETQKREPRSVPKKLLAGIWATAALVCLGTLAATAGLRVMLAGLAHRPVTAKRVPERAPVPRALVNAKYSSNATEAKPFLVEVQDAEKRRWLLWFDHDSAETVPVARTPEPPAASSRKSAAEVSGSARRETNAKPGRRNNFPLVAPKVIRTKPNGVSDASLSGVPVLPQGAPPLDAALNGILGRETKPEPGFQQPAVGGDVRPARLIKSAPPDYPALAKANRVTGDVTLDALIDSNGRVTDVKVVAGHNLLREAAMEALRSWKYEPARLGGRPVPMRLSVTVKFHLD